MEDIEYYDIPVYNFPYDVEEDDEDTIQDNSELRVSIYLDRDTRAVVHTVCTGYDAVRDCGVGGGGRD